jgi:hypothetical protein
MRSISSMLYVVACLLLFAISLHASEYGPNTLFQMPYEADEYIGNFTGTLCVGKTDSAYNSGGNAVSFLQHYENEDLLLSFIDPSASHDIIEKIGTMSFQGDLDFVLMNLSYYKNIMHHMFLGMGAIVQNLTVNITDVAIDITAPLTNEQQHLLTAFENKIPSILNTSGILSAYLECGYNRKFIDLPWTDAFQVFLRGAILTPQWVQGGELNNLQFPFTGNLTFGYQVIATLTMQMTKHMTFGVFGTVNSFQSKVMEISDNAHIVNNQLLIDKKSKVHYTPGTVYNGAVYWQLDNFKHDFVLITGLSFMYGSARKIKPISSTGYQPQHHSDVNLRLNSTLQDWALNALFFELDYNFLSKDNPQGPCIGLFYNFPVSGYNYPRVNAVGGEFGLTFNYPI